MALKEIGSEFWAPPAQLAASENGLFPPGTVWFGAGRQALASIIEDIRKNRRLETAALPAWCCDSMAEPFLRAGVKVEFYCVEALPGGGLRRELPEPGSVDAVLVLDYFGYAESGPTPRGDWAVIRDLTHGLFTRVPDDADYYFGSMRKWGAFVTGGYAWKKNGALTPPSAPPYALYCDMRRRAFREKAEFIAGRTGSQDYLHLFAEAEDILDGDPAVYAGERRDEAAARGADPAAIRAARRRNAAVLLEEFAGWALFPQPGEADCPMFVPVLVPGGKRNRLRRWLIERAVYLPVHWPPHPSVKVPAATLPLYENGLSFVCDQRYGKTEMLRICKLVREFKREESL